MYPINKLSNIYDKQIRIRCEETRQKYLTCLENNFNDKFECQPYGDEFVKCISLFDKEFRVKYKLKKTSNYEY
jgi:hypothetical protein|tara:strand:+ start:1362 stop:1580 length:219 start_codon:yes stop_codon:yes gene_type:complete